MKRSGSPHSSPGNEGRPPRRAGSSAGTPRTQTRPGLPRLPAGAPHTYTHGGSCSLPQPTKKNPLVTTRPFRPSDVSAAARRTEPSAHEGNEARRLHSEPLPGALPAGTLRSPRQVTAHGADRHRPPSRPRSARHAAPRPARCGTQRRAAAGGCGPRSAARGGGGAAQPRVSAAAAAAEPPPARRHHLVVPRGVLTHLGVPQRDAVTSRDADTPRTPRPSLRPDTASPLPPAPRSPAPRSTHFPHLSDTGRARRRRAATRRRRRGSLLQRQTSFLFL